MEKCGLDCLLELLEKSVHLFFSNKLASFNSETIDKV